MKKRATVIVASLFVATLLTVNVAQAGPGTNHRPTIYVPGQINQNSTRTRGVIKKIVARAVQAESTLQSKAISNAFKTNSSKKLAYLRGSDVQVTAAKLDLGNRTNSDKRSFKGMELSVKVKSPAGNRTRTATIKVKDRWVLEDISAALNVEFGK